MNGDAVRAVDEAGRGLCSLLAVVGIGPRLKALWDLKLAFEALPVPFASVKQRPPRACAEMFV
jgi:hypothetical protein